MRRKRLKKQNKAAFRRIFCKFPGKPLCFAPAVCVPPWRHGMAVRIFVHPVFVASAHWILNRFGEFSCLTL